MVFPFNKINDFSIAISKKNELFRKSLRKFSDNYVAPKVMDIETNNTIPYDLIEKAIKLGLTGIGIPEEYGGQGGGSMEMAILAEELSRVSPAFLATVFINLLFTYPILKYGTEEQKMKYLPPVARGEVFAAHANTEPTAGSDVAGIRATAKKRRGKWIINGRKIFITGAKNASFLIISARTSPPLNKKKWWGITIFIVETDWPGVEIGSKFHVIGLRGDQPNEVILNNVEVPERNALQPIDKGFKILMDTYDHSRIGVAAQAVGIAQGVFEKAFNYSLQRTAFGRKIISFESISFKLADMLTKIQAARLLTYWAATLADKNREEAIFASSMAKTYATETAEEVANFAIKIHGGVGVDKETGVERYFRDAVITTIYEGANDIQRLTTIKQLLKIALGAETSKKR